MREVRFKGSTAVYLCSKYSMKTQCSEFAQDHGVGFFGWQGTIPGDTQVFFSYTQWINSKWKSCHFFGLAYPQGPLSDLFLHILCSCRLWLRYSRLGNSVQRRKRIRFCSWLFWPCCDCYFSICDLLPYDKWTHEVVVPVLLHGHAFSGPHAPYLQE